MKEAARKHGLKVRKVESWVERFEPELLELAELAEDDGECLVIVHG